ncbi:unnamed protein product [Linum tenue]|uniref:Large ribosomal subunit protein bL20c n=1 Tax=Linum tenue TaxID=586396 RepID=A0AAV0PBC4_9ROSI|nr:unnamed protein product [Linum tenue]
MVSSSYSRLINNLYKGQLLLNRKILAQITILNRNCLYMIFLSCNPNYRNHCKDECGTIPEEVTKTFLGRLKKTFPITIVSTISY